MMNMLKRRRAGAHAAKLCVLAFLAVLCQAQIASAQWTTNGTNINNTNPGNVGIGTTTPTSPLHISSSTTDVNRGITNEQTSADGNSSMFTFKKSRAGGSALDTDNIGNLFASAHDGTSFVSAARLRFTIDGTVATGSVPTSIQFFTGNNASGIERMRISSAGNVGIGTSIPAARFHLVGASGASGAAAPLAFTVIGGNGGNGAGVGGAGGDLSLQGGGGGWNTTGSSFYYSGNGGAINLLGGTGGQHLFGVSHAGIGGVVNITGGTGGAHNVAGFPGGVGGSIVLNGGVGGTGTYEGAAGNVILANLRGSVGVGTLTPGYRLDVQGGAINSSGGLCIAGDCKTAWSQLTGTSQWSTTGANISFDTGNVGIGTNSPTAARLHLYNNANTYLRIGSPLANQSAIAFNDDTNGQDIVLYRRDNTRDFTIWTATASNVFNVTQAGSIGIGTITPAQKLDVLGSINASGGLCIAGVCKTNWSQLASQWTTTGTSVSYAAGSVGIGTTSPTTPLHILSNSGNVVVGNIAANYGAIGFQSTLNINNYALTGSAAETVLNTPAGTSLSLRVNNNPTNALVLNASGNVGMGTAAPETKLHVVGDLKVTGNISAKYQDVAEWVPSLETLAAGTVVILDPRHVNHVQTSNTSYDTSVAGVVSAQPGLSLGEAGEGKALIATTGRVRVKVDATRAAIRIGDLLVTSDLPGVAMKSEPVAVGGRKMHSPGTIIGKALEPLEKGTGEILVLLSLQ